MSFKNGQKVKVRPGKGVKDAFEDGEILTVIDNERGWPILRNHRGEQIGTRPGGGWSPSRFEAYVEPKPSLDLTKPLETLEGEPVTIVLTDARGIYPLRGYIGDGEALECWLADGSYYSTGDYSEDNLRNVKPKPLEKEAYINVYKDDGTVEGTSPYATRTEADEGALKSRVGCIKVKLVEGQWDE